MEYFTWMIVLCEITLCLNSVTGNLELLDKRLLYYEPLLYDTDALHLLHLQAGESGKVLQYNFYAFKRNFSLELKRMVESRPNIIMHHNKKNTKPDMTFIYTGNVTDYPESEAKIAVINGTLQGNIVLPGDSTYHVAPSSWWLRQPTPFHTVIYSEKDYIWNHTFNSDTTLHTGHKTTQKSNVRRKRDILPPTRGKEHHVCTLKLTTDQTVWQYFMDINQREEKSRYDILFMIENHVAEANKVFENSEFFLNQGLDTEEILKGIQFEIRKIKIMTDVDCVGNEQSVLCNNDMDGEALLKGFADEEEENNISDYDYLDSDNQTDYYQEAHEMSDFEYPLTDAKYCLSFLITARILHLDRGSPLLGLSYHASKDKDGGICSNKNNGFVTLFQETRQALPALVTQLVFTHEIAHSFGALHDSMKECADFNLKEEPVDGYYLMHNVAQRGDKPNHHKLSPCSLKYISQALSLDKSTVCFTGSELPYCGNGIVDDGEECDCGNDCYNGKDNCCYSHDATESLRCRLKAAAQCSPSQGPCCDSRTCQFINSSEKVVCQNSKPCVDELYCHGEQYGSSCPPPRKDQLRDDGFICSTNGRICDAGNCNASICTLIQWRECQMTNDNQNLTVQEKEELCYIGCRRRRTDECISSHNIDMVKQHPEFLALLSNISADTTILPVHLPLGTSCNKETGYCDKFKRCQIASVDTESTISSNCRDSTVCKGHITFILRHFWWAMVLAGIICLILFLKLYTCFSAQTKSYNQEEDRLRHLDKSLLELNSKADKKHNKKNIFPSVKSVRLFFKRTNRGSVCVDSNLNPNEEEVEALSENSFTSTESDI